MKKKDSLENAFSTLKENSLPAAGQKEKILNQVLMQSRSENNSFLNKLGRFASVYPWRFAFSLSCAQGILFTLLFGAKYTNLVLSIFGG